MLFGGHEFHFANLVSHAELVWDFLTLAPAEYACRWPAATRSGELLWQFVEGVRWAFDELHRRGEAIERMRQFQLFEINGQHWSSASRAVCYLFVDVAMRVFRAIESDRPEFDSSGVSGFWNRELDLGLWTERAESIRADVIRPPEIDFQKLREACRLEWSALDAARSSPGDSRNGELPDAEIETPVVLDGPGGKPVVRGIEKRPLTLPQYDVVKKLLEAGERGLSKDELDRKSNRGDARKTLKRLADSDPDWKAVIQLAGKPGGRYRIGRGD